MAKLSVWMWLASMALAFAACSSSSSSTGGAMVGGACASAATCSGGVCAISKDFPSGYCTKGCHPADATSCPSGAVCVDDASGVPADAGVNAICYQTCTSNADCGAGLSCLEKSNHKVCRNGG